MTLGGLICAFSSFFLWTCKVFCFVFSLRQLKKKKKPRFLAVNSMRPRGHRYPSGVRCMSCLLPRKIVDIPPPTLHPRCLPLPWTSAGSPIQFSTLRRPAVFPSTLRTWAHTSSWVQELFVLLQRLPRTSFLLRTFYPSVTTFGTPAQCSVLLGYFYVLKPTLYYNPLCGYMLITGVITWPLTSKLFSFQNFFPIRNSVKWINLFHGHFKNPVCHRSSITQMIQIYSTWRQRNITIPEE